MLRPHGATLVQMARNLIASMGPHIKAAPREMVLALSPPELLIVLVDGFSCLYERVVKKEIPTCGLKYRAHHKYGRDFCLCIPPCLAGTKAEYASLGPFPHH